MTKKQTGKSIDEQLIEMGLLFNPNLMGGHVSSLAVSQKGVLMHAPLNPNTPSALLAVKQLPAEMRWLLLENAPKVIVEALRHYGVLEHAGIGSDPNIMSWAKEVGVMGWYHDDDIAWCGLFVGVVCKRCGYDIPKETLRARAWVTFGTAVERGKEKFGDILVFWRGSRSGSSGHVAFYIAESKTHFLCLGGNQSNSVSFAWIEKKRLLQARRCKWKIGQPSNVRKIYASSTGKIISTNES